MPEGQDTIPKSLKKKGYVSHCVGKWHLGSTRFKDLPVGKSWGFDQFVGLLHGAGGHYSKSISNQDGFIVLSISILFFFKFQKKIKLKGLEGAFYDYSRAYSNGSFIPIHDDRHSTKSLTSEAIELIQNHPKEKPLFLYLAYTAAHTPLLAEKEWMEKCEHLKNPIRQAFCGLVVGADEGEFLFFFS